MLSRLNCYYSSHAAQIIECVLTGHCWVGAHFLKLGLVTNVIYKRRTWWEVDAVEHFHCHCPALTTQNDKQTILCWPQWGVMQTQGTFWIICANRHLRPDRTTLLTEWYINSHFVALSNEDSVMWYGPMIVYAGQKLLRQPNLTYLI